MAAPKTATLHTPPDRERFWRWGLRLAACLALFGLWQWFGQHSKSLLFASLSETLAAFVAMLRNGELLQALWVSNQALLLGYMAALLLALPLGLALGRLAWLERLCDPYVNVLLASPMAALIPLIIVSIGLGLASRALVVFVFAFPLMVVNTRAGLKNIDPHLPEMARAYGAHELHIWQKVLIPGALPAITSGLRLGLARALAGMVTVELLMIAVGVGRVILNAMGYFEPERSFAIVAAVVLESLLLMSLMRGLENRIAAHHRLSLPVYD